MPNIPRVNSFASEGMLDAVAVPALLAGFWRSEASGELALTREGLTTSLFLDRGQVVFATSEDETFGLCEGLFRDGKIGSLVQMERLQLSLSKGDRPEATILAEEGVVREEEAIALVLKQLHNLVLEVFSWQRGVWSFQPGVRPNLSAISLERDPRLVLLEGVSTIKDYHRLAQAVGHGTGQWQLNRKEGQHLHGLNLDEGMRRILNLLQNSRSVNELCVRAGVNPVEILQNLWWLLILGVVENPSRSGAQPEKKPKRKSKKASAKEEQIEWALLPEGDVWIDHLLSGSLDPDRQGAFEGESQNSFFDDLQILDGVARHGRIHQQQQEMEFSGNLKEIDFASLIHKFHQTGATGNLVFKHREVEKAILFHNGEIVFASSNDPEDDFLSRLAEQGKLSESGFKWSRDLVDQGVRAEQAVTDLKLVGAEDLENEVNAHMQSILMTLFNWSEGGYLFQEILGLPTHKRLLSFSMADIILRGILAQKDFRQVQAELLNRNPVVALAKDPFQRFQTVTLSSAQAFLMSRIDGRTNLENLCKLSALDQEETCRLLHGLEVSGVVEAVEREQAEENRGREALKQPAKKDAPQLENLDKLIKQSRDMVEQRFGDALNADHYSFLGVPRDASEEMVEQVFENLAEIIHPDRVRLVGDEMLSNKANVVFAALVKAFATLADPVQRKAYDSLLGHEPVDSEKPAATQSHSGPPEDSRVLLTQAKIAYRDKDYSRALDLLERALLWDHENPDIHLLLGFTLAENPKWRRRAEKSIKTAQTLSPKDPGPTFQLGLLYEEWGMRDKAHQAFHQVLTLVPGHPGALEALMPTTKRPKTSLPQEPQKTSQLPPGRGVLLGVENPGLQKKFFKILENQGFPVVAVRKGREIVERAKTHPERFALVLMELGLRFPPAIVVAQSLSKSQATSGVPILGVLLPGEQPGDLSGLQDAGLAGVLRAESHHEDLASRIRQVAKGAKKGVTRGL